jgi:hypothetical protein
VQQTARQPSVGHQVRSRKKLAALMESAALPRLILPQRLIVCDRLLPLMLAFMAANTQTRKQLHLTYGLEPAATS